MKMTFASAPVRRTVQNGLAIFGGEALSRLGNFVIAIIIARRFGPAALGQYGYAISIASILVLLPDMGLHLSATQRLATEPQELPRVFWNLHWLKLGLVAGLAIFAILFGEFVIHDPGRRLLFYVLTLRVILQTFSQAYMAIIKATERMHFVTLQQAAGVAASLLTIVACILMQASLIGFVSALLAGQFCETWAGWWILRRRFRPGTVRSWSLRFGREMLVAALPVGAISILQAASLRTDVLVLSAYVSNAELGHFQAAAWLLVLTFLGGSLLMAVLFPRMVRILRSPSLSGVAWTESLIQNATLLILFGAAIVCFGAPWFLRTCYGPALLPATPSLRILAAVAPFLFLNTLLFYIFVASNRRRTYLLAFAFSASTGLALALALAPVYGGVGVGIADLARESSLSAVLVTSLYRQGLIRNLGPALLRAAGAAALIMTLIAVFSSPPHSSDAWVTAWTFSILAGGLTFLGMPKRHQFLMLAREGG